MKNKYIKHFTLLASLVFGATGVFAQETNSDCDIDSPKEEHLQYSRNVNNLESLDPDRFVQNLNPDYDLVWYTTDDPSKEPNSLGQEKMTFDRSKAGSYLFYIAYKDGDCYSERARVEVEVLAAPMPAVKNIDLCKNATFDPMDGIVSTDEPGFELIWFIDPADTVGNAMTTPPTNIVDIETPGQYTYYVAQRMKVAPYSQSDAAAIRVSVYGVKAPIDDSKHTYCANETAEELNVKIAEDRDNYFYANKVVYVAGKNENSSPFTPDTKTSSSIHYEYEAYQTYTLSSGEVCVGPKIEIDVDVIAVPAPNVLHAVNYTKAEGAATKEFVDILVKDPDVIEYIPEQTLLWSISEYGVYWHGSTSSSKPFYDEMVPFGEVEHQERWVKWQVQTTTGLTCESEASKVDITISSSPAPIVNPVAICEDDYTAGTIPGGKNLEDFVEINDYNGMMNATDYQLYWYTDKAKAEAAIKNGPSEGSATAPALNTIIDITTDPMSTKWEGEVYIVQSDGITTSPASSMRITVNASPRLLAMPHGPVCMGPVDLTSAEYWVIDNVIAATVQYTFNGSVVENPKAITQSGEYEITATSQYGCVSDPLKLQVDIRNLSIEMAAMSMTCPGGNVYSQVEIDYSYNKDSYAAPELSWTSKERGSTKPTQTGIITSADKTSFAYISGDFNGEAGSINEIEIEVTDGYCVSNAKHRVIIGNGPVEGYFSWNEPNNMSATNGSTLMLSELNKDKVIINACGDAVTVDFSEVMRDSNSDIEWYSDSNFSKPIATGDSKTFDAKEYGKYYIRYPNGCYASASFEIVDASVEILTTSDGVIKLNEKESYSKEIMVSSAVSPLSFAWYKDGEPFTNNSDVLTFKSLNVANSGLYTIEYHSGACSAKLDVVDLKVIELDNAVISISANDPDEIINVYTITGALVKSNIKRSEALNGLANGAYVVGGVKVIVNK